MKPLVCLLYVCCVMVDSKSEELAELLLERGANKDYQYGKGRTATHLAVIREKIVILKALIKHGADLNVKVSIFICSSMFFCQLSSFVFHLQSIYKHNHKVITMEEKKCKTSPSSSLSCEVSVMFYSGKNTSANFLLFFLNVAEL